MPIQIITMSYPNALGASAQELYIDLLLINFFFFWSFKNLLDQMDMSDGEQK